MPSIVTISHQQRSEVCCFKEADNISNTIRLAYIDLPVPALCPICADKTANLYFRVGPAVDRAGRSCPDKKIG